MISKEAIKSEIEKVPSERLDELYQIVRSFAAHHDAGKANKSFMSRLREIQLDGPEDFAANIDQYLSGEKTVG